MIDYKEVQRELILKEEYTEKEMWMIKKLEEWLENDDIDYPNESMIMEMLENNDDFPF